MTFIEILVESTSQTRECQRLLSVYVRYLSSADVGMNDQSDPPQPPQ